MSGSHRAVLSADTIRLSRDLESWPGAAGHHVPRDGGASEAGAPVGSPPPRTPARAARHRQNPRLLEIVEAAEIEEAEAAFEVVRRAQAVPDRGWAWVVVALAAAVALYALWRTMH